MLSLYIHIPFCISKCNYCDFLSFPADEPSQEAYVEALSKEIQLYGRSGNYRLASLYFGGGTPTLLTEKLFIQLFSAIRANFLIDENCEITVEANPGTLTLGKIQLLKDLGVNRLSIGVQSMHNDELLLMGRVHCAADVIKCVEIINQVKIDNYSFDFIGGVPFQTEEKLLQSLNVAIELAPKHISLYGLKLEPGTPWEKLEAQNKLSLPEEDEVANMMATAKDFLTSKGYARYEISNYALKGFSSRHNMQYWLNEQYLGLGLGASSYFARERFTNERDMKIYQQLLKKEVFPVALREKITCEIEKAETVFLSLRLIEGIRLGSFKKRFGKELTEIFGTQVKKHTQLGLLELTPTHLRLTPRGLDIANEVMLDFLP